MGITISYRGTLANLDRIEDFEDRVLDLALELGSQAHLWRTAADKDSSRLIRGVILDLCPGQETTSLLVSPEGWLIGLADIEDAEELAEGDESDDDGGFEAPDRHPLQRRASDLLMRLHKVMPPAAEARSRSGGALTEGACDIAGGLAQALSFDDDDEFAAGLCVVQLKRALRGAAFALGALYPLRADDLLDVETFDELHATITGLQKDIYEELRRRRS
jgi:hypothetical protein